jgi:hypothetical protein
MIEFKGAYYKNKSSPPQSVLVQFDGALLHVWNMSSPFYRIQSSDAFRVPLVLGRRQCWVRLLNGGRILTNDIQALCELKSSYRSALPAGLRLGPTGWPTAIVFSALVSVLVTGLFIGMFFW